MNKKQFADRSYSEQLKDDFPDADFFWLECRVDGWIIASKEYCNGPADSQPRPPAITTDMVLEKLRNIDSVPTIKLNIFKDDTMCWLPGNGNVLYRNKKLVNALCSMYIYLKKEGLL